MIQTRKDLFRAITFFLCNRQLQAISFICPETRLYLAGSTLASNRPKRERIHFEQWMIWAVHPRCQQKGMHGDSARVTLWEQRPKFPAGPEPGGWWLVAGARIYSPFLSFEQS